MRILRIIYFEAKQLYKRGFIAFWLVLIAYSLFIDVFFAKHPGVALDVAFIFLNYLILMILPMSLTGYVLIKSTIDVVFTTQIDPIEYYMARAIAGGLTYPLMFITLTVYAIEPGLDLIYYILTILLLSGFLALLTVNIQLAPWRIRLPLITLLIIIAALGFINHEASPLYGLVRPRPIYVAYTLVLLAIAVATTPRRRIRELATNAYGVLGTQTSLLYRMPYRRSTGSIEFPRTLWGVIWATSTHSGGSNTLRTIILASTSSAAAYGVLIALLTHGIIMSTPYVNWQITSSSTSFTIIYTYLLFFSMFTVSNERLWLSLSIDPVQYFKYRMIARTLIMAIALLPWITVYLIQGIYFKPSIYLALMLISVVMIMPTLGWLLAAYVDVPQVRELGLRQRTEPLTLKASLVFLFLLITLSIFMTPYSLASLALSIRYAWLRAIINMVSEAITVILLVASIIFFYYTVVSKRGKGMWSWLVNKLSENGYA